MIYIIAFTIPFPLSVMVDRFTYRAGLGILKMFHDSGPAVTIPTVRIPLRCAGKIVRSSSFAHPPTLMQRIAANFISMAISIALDAQNK